MENTKTELELRHSIRDIGGNVIDMPDERFHKWARMLTNEQIVLLLEKHRGNRNFYKKILQEERRQTHPNSLRYEDAAKLIVKYNAQGKILAEIKKESVSQT